MRKIMLVLVAVAVMLVGGCGTKVAYTPIPEAEHVNPAGKFSVGEVTDASGFVFPPDEKNPFKLTDAMRDALRAELEKRAAFATPGDYVLNVSILYYLPGNAFIRWLAPGAGRTSLHIVCTVTDTDGKELAKIPMHRYIAAGGGYTIGAYKYIFVDVAETLVKTLQNEDKRKAQKTSE